MPRASLWRRLGAMLYDAMIVVAIWMATTFLLVLFTGTELTGFWWQSFLFVEWFAFFVYFWTNDGQTVGMMAWRIKTLQADGSTPTVMQCAKRLAVAPASFCLGLLGYFWMFLNEEKATWHDLFSNTVVVHFPKEEQ